MKILIVTTRVPYPPFKGDKLKIYNIVKHLAKTNSVKVLCLANNRSELKYLENIRALGAEVEIEAVMHSTLHSLSAAALGVFTKRPIQVSLYRNKRLGKRLGEIVREDAPDVVYFHFIRAAQYVKDMPAGTSAKVFDFTDAVSLYLTRFVATAKNPFVKLAVANERNRIEKYEPIAEKFDTCFICSPLDRDYLLQRGIKAEFQILPNGVDTETFDGLRETFDENRIIFTGNMPYFPNEDAAVYFGQSIFPLILKEVASAKLFLVGGKPTRKIRRLASPSVVVTGFVEDIAAEYRKSAVAIAPMRFGAGTLNKVIEAIVLGIPVVATSIAVRGLPDVAQNAVKVADTPEEFAAAVVNVLKCRNPARPQSEAADSKLRLDQIRRALSWEKIVGDFEIFLKTRFQLKD